jgi:serine/threonine-protein kinase
MASDHNLLFGLLALQNGLIQQAQLVSAFHAWTCDKSRSLADHLVALGHLAPGQRSVVDAIAALHLQAHAGDVERSLAACRAGKSMRESLTRLGDPEIAATLGHVGSGRGSTEQDGQAEGDATTNYSVGTTTSDGQRFRVLRPHARGGLGAVLVALDTELHREVALKQILNEHANDPGSRRRFLLEAEITGALEHPGIVPVYGLGTYGDGQPYYAMRFIRGDSLKEAVERFHADPLLQTDGGQRSLELRKLLRQFVDVCNAIGYAHSRGVVHRDIKPANVILGNHGETLVVDWGLAKITGRSDSSGEERTLQVSSTSGSSETLPGSALGTPAYMSPEQAAGRLQEVGPRSDIYSLGATLYCVLTGRPPISGEAGEVLRAVQKGEFPPPRQLDPSIDKALESVCQKALALNPAERYASTKALADDVERWLADEPVTAWRESPWCKARRWGRRNRTAVTAAAVAVLMATAGLATILAMQTRANHTLRKVNDQLRAASERESLANASLRAANGEVVRQSQLARRNFLKARQAVDDSFTRISENALLKSPLPGLQPLRKELLESTLRYYQDFVGEAADDPAVRSELAAAYLRAGSIDAELGSYQDALKEFDSARELYQELVKVMPDDRGLRIALAECDQKAGLAFYDQDRYPECVPLLLRAIALEERLVRQAPGDTRLVAALAASHNKLFAGLFMLGRHEEADPHYHAAVSLRERLVALEPGNPEFRSDLALTRNNHVYARESRGQTEGNIDLMQQARADLERVVAEHPDNLTFRAALGLVACNQGRVLAIRGQRVEALEALQQSHKLCLQLVRENPTVDLFHSRLTYASIWYARWLNATARHHDALDVVRQIREILEADISKDATRVDRRADLGIILVIQGDALAREGQLETALATLNQGITMSEAALGKSAKGPDQYEVACAYSLKAGLLGRAPDKVVGAGDASQAAELAVDRLRRLVARGWRMRHWLTNDPQLEAIRGRADFQKLIADLSVPKDPAAGKK